MVFVNHKHYSIEQFTSKTILLLFVCLNLVHSLSLTHFSIIHHFLSSIFSCCLFHSFIHSLFQCCIFSLYVMHFHGLLFRCFWPHICCCCCNCLMFCVFLLYVWLVATKTYVFNTYINYHTLNAQRDSNIWTAVFLNNWNAN